MTATPISRNTTVPGDGRQDLHVHSCYAGCWEGPLPEDACNRVLIAPGRDCDGTSDSHHRETLP